MFKSLEHTKKFKHMLEKRFGIRIYTLIWRSDPPSKYTFKYSPKRSKTPTKVYKVYNIAGMNNLGFTYAFRMNHGVMYLS